MMVRQMALISCFTAALSTAAFAQTVRLYERR